MRVLLVHCKHRPFEVDRFSRAWVAAGGNPAELFPVTPAAAREVLVESPVPVDGLLLTGGPDVEPWRYGQRPQPGVELDTDPGRDALDLLLLSRADGEGWPVLAVCYGCQLLAVHRGGTLVQDLPHQGQGHNLRDGRRDRFAHPVLRRGSPRFLSWLPEELPVNSRHHQAVDLPGRDLVVVGRAPDGVVEAVEAGEGDRFEVGVQWHPEDLISEPHLELFRSFRRACQARSLVSPGGEE
jgi:putative glutamine amidotransferase